MEMTFTKVPNVVFEVLPSLAPNEVQLFMCLIRLTSGYHQGCCSPASSELEAATDLGQTSIYEARKSLEQRGLIRVERNPGARCVYWLTLERLLEEDDAPRTPSEKRGGSLRKPRGGPRKTEGGYLGKPRGGPSENRGGSPSENRGGPILKKDQKKNSKERSSELSLSPGDDDFSPSVFEEPEPERPVGLTPAGAQLVAIGVSEHKARALSVQRPATTARALANLEHRPHIRDKAAYLVREIERGGYDEPASLADARRRKEAEHRRQVERLAAASSHESAVEREALDWAGLVLSTPADELAAAAAAVRSRPDMPPRIAEASLRALLERRHDQVAPFVRGPVREWLRARANPGRAG